MVSQVVKKSACNVGVQFSSVTQSCPTLCNPMNCSTPGLPVHDQLPESTQTHVHFVSDAIKPSHPLLSPSPPALNFPSIRVFSNESALCIIDTDIYLSRQTNQKSHKLGSILPEPQKSDNLEHAHTNGTENSYPWNEYP